MTFNFTSLYREILEEAAIYLYKNKIIFFHISIVFTLIIIFYKFVNIKLDLLKYYLNFNYVINYTIYIYSLIFGLAILPFLFTIVFDIFKKEKKNKKEQNNIEFEINNFFKIKKNELYNKKRKLKMLIGFYFVIIFTIIICIDGSNKNFIKLNDEIQYKTTDNKISTGYLIYYNGDDYIIFNKDKINKNDLIKINDVIIINKDKINYIKFSHK